MFIRKVSTNSVAPTAKMARYSRVPVLVSPNEAVRKHVDVLLTGEGRGGSRLCGCFLEQWK